MSAILLFFIFLKTKECGIRSVVGHIIVVITGIRGKNLQNFIFHNNANEMKKKSVSKPLFFFSEEEDVTVNDVRDIGYVERSNNIIAVY